MVIVGVHTGLYRRRRPRRVGESASNITATALTCHPPTNHDGEQNCNQSVPVSLVSVQHPEKKHNQCAIFCVVIEGGNFNQPLTLIYRCSDSVLESGCPSNRHQRPWSTCVFELVTSVYLYFCCGRRRMLPAANTNPEFILYQTQAGVVCFLNNE
jgi:hypothetical protein